MRKAAFRVLLAMSLAVVGGCQHPISDSMRLVRTDARPILWPTRCHMAGVCLVYTGPVVDTDRDFVSDEDEKALRTDPAVFDAEFPVARITAAVGKGSLPSFSRGASEIIIMPKIGPDGRSLSAPDLAGVRVSSAERLGISDATLKGYGLSVDQGIVLQPIPGIGAADKDGKPPRRIGGIDIGLISAEGGDGGVPGEGGDGAPVRPHNEDTPVFGGGSQEGAKSLGQVLTDGLKKMFGPSDKPDGGTRQLTSGEVDATVPLTEADFKRVATRLGGTRTPVPVRPDVGNDGSNVDFNPRRTIALVMDDGTADPRFESALKLVLTVPKFDNPAAQNTNFGPNGGIVPGVVKDSIWPKR